MNNNNDPEEAAPPSATATATTASVGAASERRALPDGSSAATRIGNDILLPENRGRVKQLVSVLLSKRAVGNRPVARFQASVDYLASALHNQPFDYHDRRWATALLEQRRNRQHGGSTQEHWRDWRRWFPDQPALWRHVRNGHSDPKVSEDFDYQAISVPRAQGISSYSAEEASFMTTYFTTLQTMGVARLCDSRDDRHGSPVCYLRLAFVPKDDGSRRMIVDGKAMSENEDPPSFRCIRVQDLADWMRPRTRLLRIDLVKYYWMFAASLTQMQLQRFWTPDGRDAILQTMSMGVKGSGYWGGRCFAGSWVLVFQALGIDIIGYMDEGLLQETDPVMAKVQQVFVITILEDVALSCHLTDQLLEDDECKTDMAAPLIAAKFIGCIVDPVLGRLSPSPARLERIRNDARQLQRHMLDCTSAPMSLVASLLGRIRSCLRIHVQAGFLSLKLNHILVAHGRAFGVDRRELRRAVLPQALQYVSNELKYWSGHHPVDEYVMINNQVPTQVTVIGDASEYGVSVGATVTSAAGLGPASLLLSQAFLLQFKFSSEDQITYHHNFKEAMVPIEALRALHDWTYVEEGRPGAPVRLLNLTDNMTVRSAFKNKRTRSVEIARIMAPLMSDLNRWNWIAGSEYLEKLLMDATIHDSGSRAVSTIWDCGLPPWMVCCLLANQGLSSADLIDLFAESATAVSQRFVSRFPRSASDSTPAPIWVDALAGSSPPWSAAANPHISAGTVLWAYPPPRFLLQVFAKIEADCTESILVVMPLRSQRAMPAFERLLTQTPTLTSIAVQELVVPEGTNPTIEQAYGQRLDLIAGALSGCPERRKAYQLSRYETP